MRRRSLLYIGGLLPLAAFGMRSLRALTLHVPSSEEQRLTAARLQELAANVRTLADAQLFVDFIADLFARETPRGLRSRPLRSQIAQAELATVSGKGLIPELRVAEAWNAFSHTLQMPPESLVSAAEIHTLRAKLLVSAQVLWESDMGRTNIWSVPSIYATTPDGRAADGCRAIEAVRILWDLAEMPRNITDLREQRQKQPPNFDTSLTPAAHPPTGERFSFQSFATVTAYRNPFHPARQQYIEKNGSRALQREVVRMLEGALGLMSA